MVSDGIKRMISDKHLTIQQVSDLSDVPVSTINRIISAQTKDPGILTVTAIVYAVGGSLDDLMGQGREENAAPQKTEHDAVVGIYERAVEQKNNWIRRLFVLCCVLLSVLIVYIVLDASIGSFGIIRY